MPLTELDPNVSGRNSRASNFSGSYKNVIKPASDVLSVNPAVLGMLKTTTEYGDLSTLPTKQNRLPKRPYGPPRQSSGMSRTSSHISRPGSLKSMRSSLLSGENPSMPGSWPYGHPQVHSQALQHIGIDTRFSGPNGSGRSLASVANDRLTPDDRSYSMTNSLHLSRSLNNHQSLASLRSQPMQARPRSPYVYPTRLRRPNYRPTSPAFSDTVSINHNREIGSRPMAGLRAHSTSPLPPQRVSKLAYHQGLNNSDPIIMPNSSLDDPRRHFGIVRQFTQVPFFEESQPRRMGSRSPVLMHHPNYSQPNQQFRATPSPLQRHYTGHVVVPSKKPHTSDTTPYVGFVQRVKTVLEERLSIEDIDLNARLQNVQAERATPLAELPASPVGKRLTREMIKSVVAVDSSPDLLSDTTTDTMYDLPQETSEDVVDVESPPDLPGLVSTPTPEVVRRLTRDMIRGAVGPSSGPIAPSPSPHKSSLFNVNDDQQSGEESSSGTGGSVEIPRSASTPDGVQHPRSITSEATASTVELSTDPVDMTVGFSLPNTTPPKMSELTAVTQDIFEVSEERHDSTTEHSIRDYSFQRPMSLPDIPDRKTDRMSVESKRSLTKSLPASKDLYQGTSPGFITEDINDENEHDIDPREFATNIATIILPPEAGDENNPTSSVRSVNSVRPPSWTSKAILNRQTYTPASHTSRFSNTSAWNDNLPNPHRSGASTSQPAFPNRSSSLKELAVLNNAEVESKRPRTTLYMNEVRPRNSSTTTDLRLSGFKQLNQFPLPDLTEDSQEDASTTNLRLLGPMKRPAFRSGGMNVPRSDARFSKRVPAPREPPRSYFSPRALSETRNIPSLNFSRVDLTTTLNHALELRSSKSLEDMPHHRSAVLPIETIERLTSSTTLRDRYKSFFSLHDEFEDQEEVEIASEWPSQRHSRVSQEEIIIEINRLSIPSMNNLTLRLSELLPSLKGRDSADDLTMDEEVRNLTVDESRDFESSDTRPFPTSVGTATLRSIGMVINDLEAVGERTSRELSSLQLMKDLSPLPSDESHHRMSLESGPTRTIASSQPLTIPVAPPHAPIYQSPNQLEAPSAPISPLDLPEGIHELPGPSPTKIGSVRPSHSALEGTPQPWDNGHNFPWSGEPPTLDIGLPSALDGGRGFPAPRNKLKKSRSTAHAPVDEAVRIARSMSPGPRLDASLVPRTDIFTDLELQFSSKKGILSSFTRKIGIKPRIDKAGFPIDPMFLHPEDRAVDPGDRYPTSGLTPPAGIHVEAETRSYFSDDSSHSDHVVSLRKRLTRLKPKRSAAASRALSPGNSRDDILRHPVQGRKEGSLFGGHSMEINGHDNVLFVYEQTPEGMSKMEFRAKSMVEKIRKLWYKSGEVIRNVSRMQKSSPRWHDGNELYAGV